MHRPALAAALALFPAHTAAAAVDYALLPAVSESTATGVMTLLVRSDPPVDAVRLELSPTGCLAGPIDGFVDLLPLGTLPATTFVGMPRAADLLAYDVPDAVHRPVAGCLRLSVGGVESDSRHLLVNVADDSIARVPVRDLAPGVRWSPHVVNLLIDDDGSFGPLSPTLPDVFAEEEDLLQRFHALICDDFDFANVVTVLPSTFDNRSHLVVNNDIGGIGMALSDDSDRYGNPRLRGVTRFPLDTFFDLGSEAAVHELGHQWTNSLCSTTHPVSLLCDAGRHWPPSDPALGVMGTSSIPGRQGLDFPYAFFDVGGGTYRIDPAPPTGEFSSIDLYLLGLLPAEDVAPFVVADPIDQPIFVGALVSGTLVSAADIVAAVGPRVPSRSPSHYAMATVILSRMRLLDETEMRFFDHFAARGEATTEHLAGDGIFSQVEKPFALATGGRAALVTDISPQTYPCLPRPPPRIEDPCPPTFSSRPGIPPRLCGEPPFPEPFWGLTISIDVAVIPWEGVRTSLSSKAIAAGMAAARGDVSLAGRHLDALLGELVVQSGRAFPEATGQTLTAVTLAVAADQKIPIGRRGPPIKIGPPPK